MVDLGPLLGYLLEAVVQCMFVGVAPVLKVYTEAVKTLVGQQMQVLVAQPVFSSWLTETIAVL